MVRGAKMKEPDVAKTYDMFQKIGFFNKSDAVSRKHIQNINDVLVRFGDIQKPIEIERLVAAGVTPLVD